MPRREVASRAVSYSRRLPGPSLTTPLCSQANEGMNFGSSMPGMASWAIAPTYAPVFKSVPMHVFTWSPIRAPTLFEPVSIAVRPSRTTLTRP